MALTKIQKQKILEGLREKFEQKKSMVFLDFTGLKMKGLAGLRRKMKEQGCEFKVAKKTLISLMLGGKKSEIDFKRLKGELALGFGYKDEILPFKILHEFSRQNENLKILGGLIGNDFLEKEKAIALAQLPGREELLAKLVGTIASPMSGFLNVLQGNLRGLVFVLSAIKK